MFLDIHFSYSCHSFTVDTVAIVVGQSVTYDNRTSSLSVVVDKYAIFIGIYNNYTVQQQYELQFLKGCIILRIKKKLDGPIIIVKIANWHRHQFFHNIIATKWLLWRMFNSLYGVIILILRLRTISLICYFFSLHLLPAQPF